MIETLPFTFVHTADLHLDSPFEGIHAVEPRIAAALRQATFKAFDHVIELAVRERADFLIVSGDVYDGADRSLLAQLRFRDGLKRAVDRGVKCFVAHGNHDPLSGWEARLSLPDEVHRFAGQEVEEVVVRRDGRPLARLHGISYPVSQVRQNLASGYRRGDPIPFAIGVLHCNLGGNPAHDNYAPCTVEDLMAAGLDYWALGHFHARQIVREQSPAIIYPGNTQGRSVRELGPRGCYLVRVDETGGVYPEFVATDAVRWFHQEIDLSPLGALEELLDRLHQTREEARAEAEGRGAVLRLSLTGRGELHRELKRPDAESDLALKLREGEADRADFVWTETVENRSRPPLDLEQRRQVQDFVGDFLNAAQEIRSAEDPGSLLRQLLAARPEHRVIAQELAGLEDETLLAILSEAETLGLDLLLPEEE